MDTSIRKYIINNLNDCDQNDIKETILASVNSEDEVVLPGLGVLFEMIWSNGSEELKNNIIELIYENVKKA